MVFWLHLLKTSHNKFLHARISHQVFVRPPDKIKMKWDRSRINNSYVILMDLVDRPRIERALIERVIILPLNMEIQTHLISSYPKSMVFLMATNPKLMSLSCRNDLVWLRDSWLNDFGKVIIFKVFFDWII